MSTQKSKLHEDITFRLAIYITYCIIFQVEGKTINERGISLSTPKKNKTGKLECCICRASL